MANADDASRYKSLPSNIYHIRNFATFPSRGKEIHLREWTIIQVSFGTAFQEVVKGSCLLAQVCVRKDPT